MVTELEICHRMTSNKQRELRDRKDKSGKPKFHAREDSNIVETQDGKRMLAMGLKQQLLGKMKMLQKGG